MPFEFPKNPLTLEDGQRIFEALRVLHDVDDMIRRAEGCGENCDANKALSAHLRDKLERYRATFFPNGLPKR